MRQAGAVWLLGFLLAVGAAAQEVPKPPETPKLSEAVRRGWLRARILSGRIAFSGMRLRTPGESAESGERLSIRFADGQLVVRYEMPTEEEELLVEVSGDSELHIRRTPKGESGLTAVDFLQPASGPLSLTLGSGRQRRVWQAASLWHLFLLEPEVSRRHLAPLLAVLNDQWDITGTADQVEAALVRAAASGELPDPKRWAALVEQLRDSRFSRREAADRQLRSLGRVVFTFLQDLDPSRLDAEQHYRVQRILAHLSASMEDDSPLEIAGWPAGDPAVWLALLSRPDESTRRLAAEQIEALLGEPVAFDPAADAATRASQIEQLRSRLGQQ